jgi:hypothetical protein
VGSKNKTASDFEKKKIIPVPAKIFPQNKNNNNKPSFLPSSSSHDQWGHGD